ncbi:MAG: histidine kinase [Candidatus Cloacimonetes bacterium]|nr:histidine kinase [Candidatus Cloacimonadota bacterium]
MVKEINLYNHEKMMYNWWSKIRWFMVIILFAIGILRVQQSPQTFPIIIFVTVFFGICILNILYHLQIIKTNNIFGTVQIVLDVVFATLVVHLTGGIESSFVWIYLIAVITASLSVEKAGGFISALIGSMSLLALILFYNFEWLIPVDGSSFNSDASSQTIFLISYTGLFTAIAFISNFISDMLKKLSLQFSENKILYKERENQLLEKERIIAENKKKIGNFQKVVKTAAEIADIDHALNNPLSVISLSVSRVKKASTEYNDERLSKSSNQITEAINKINGILVRLQELKRFDLIQKERKK